MYEPLESNKNSNLPSKNKFARTFRILSRISYWIHIILGAISALTLLLVVFSRDATNSTGTGVGIFIIMFSLLALGFRVYWSWRYRQLAKKLQTVNYPTRQQPSRSEIIRVLRIGLLASSIGLLLAFLASEISLVSLVADAIARPQGVAVYEREQVIKIADLLLILAELNILGAHFFGSANSLGLLSWISKEEV